MTEPRPEWKTLQRDLADRVVLPAQGPDFDLRQQALALDVQYVDDVAHVGASLHRIDGTHLASFSGEAPVEAEYVPGYFCFREGPPLLAMVRRLQADGLADPALLVIDGHGIAHPRRFGIACWLGLACRLPTLGCAKQTLVPYEGEPAPERGAAHPVCVDDELRGWVLRTQDGVKPIFVSPGHRISYSTCSHVVMQLAGPYRVPDPVRFADQAARARARGEALDGVTELGPLAPATPAWDLPEGT